LPTRAPFSENSYQLFLFAGFSFDESRRWHSGEAAATAPEMDQPALPLEDAVFLLFREVFA